MKQLISGLLFSLILLLVNENALAQPCSGGANAGTLTMTGCWQSISTTGQQYYNFSAVNGSVYQFSYCTGDGGSDGGDSYLTLRTGADALIANADDNCDGNNAYLSWTATSTATFRILSTNYPCNAGAVGTLRYRCQSCGTAPANPGAGSNTWNVLCYLNTDVNLGGAFRGYYQQNIDGNATYGYGFNTEAAWAKATSPSCAAGYTGANVPYDTYTFVHKRTGFPCGMYDITVEKWDDDSQLYIDGIRIYNASFGGSTTAGNIAVGPYYLLSTSTIEFRTQEGGGDAHAGVKIIARATSSALSLSNTVTNACPSASNGTINATLANGLTGAKRLRITQLKNDFMNIAEIRAIELFSGTNVALTSNGGTAAMSSLNNAAYPATELINNITNVSGDMGHTNSGVGQWMEITFNTPKNIDRVELLNRSDCCWDRASALRLELYDNAGTLIYSKVIDVHQGNNNGTFVATFNIMDYTWSNSATTEDQTGLAAGTYTLTVSDVRCGNTSTSPVIGTNPLPQVSGFSGNTMCAGDNNARLTVTTSSGTGPFNVVYNTGSNGSVTSGTSFLAVPQNPGSTTNYTLTSVTDANGCVRSSGFTDGSATVTVNPQPQGTFTQNPYCMAGSGSTGQLVWTATAGSPSFTVNYTAGATTNSPSYSTSFTGSSAVGTPQTITVGYQPIETTTYTVTAISDANGCTASSFPAAVPITVTDVAPTYGVTTTTPSGMSAPVYSPTYPPGAGVAPGWGKAGGQTITYSNATGWPACTNWGISIPSLTTAVPATTNALKLDITDAANTDFTAGKLRFTGTATYYYMSGGNMVNSVLNIRCTVTTGGVPIQYLPSAGYFTLRPTGTSNLVINILFETQVPNPNPFQFASGLVAGTWQPSVDLYNSIHAPASGTGSVITSGFTNGFYFYNISGLTTAVSASAPASLCIAYPSGGVPNGGPLNLSGGTGSLNTTCSLTHLWTSSASPLINTGVEDPTPIVSQATSTYLTTYTYTVSSASNRVCYGTATTGTPVANTTSPTTWTGTNSGGSDSWYDHNNWTNCVPCNTSPANCNKQAVFNAAATTYQPSINTPGAKAYGVAGTTPAILNNGKVITTTTNCQTAGMPSTPCLKLITP